MKPAHLLACAGAGLGLGSGASLPATAQTPAEPQRVEIRGEAGNDTDQRRRESVAKQIYGREELDRHGDLNVNEVLKRLPGITLQGGNPRLRGLGAGYTLILVNGERPPPGFSLDNLTPAEVERIEVTKGPTAEHSAQAVAGTINIVLRSQARTRQREWRGTIGHAGDRVVGGTNLLWSDRSGSLGYTLPISGWQWSSRNQSWTDREAPDNNQQPQRIVSQPHSRWWGGGVSLGPRLSWKIDEQTTVESQSYLQRNEWRAAGAWQTLFFEGAPPVYEGEDWFNRGHWQMARTGLQLNRRWSSGARLELKLGTQYSSSAFRNDTDVHPPAQPDFLRLTTGSNSERSHTTSGKQTLPVGEAHTLAFGWEVEQRSRFEQRSVLERGVEQLAGFEGEPFRARVLRSALWLQDEWAIDSRWSAYLGLRGERVDTRSVGSADELRGRSAVITPLLHLNFKPDPKKRDLVRASLTRSYRAPELNALLARPSINSAYPIDRTNIALSPDRVGNPALQPELSTGLDLAYEVYLADGGIVSLGLFHRRISGLIRSQTTLETRVPWASAARWVHKPVNLEGARSTGIEAEVKGRLRDLLPDLGAPQGLSVRASLALYRSQVDGLPGPDDRLEGQQPWSLNLGFDHVVEGSPLSYGASLAATPAFGVQQTALQHVDTSAARTLDAYAAWRFSPSVTLRLSLGNLFPLTARTATVADDGLTPPQTTVDRRTSQRHSHVSLTIKF